MVDDFYSYNFGLVYLPYAYDFVVSAVVDGIVDKFHEKNLRIFGPDKKVAMLEGSKAFAKDFMEKYGVRTAKYKSFTEKEKALEYLKEMNYPVYAKHINCKTGKGVVKLKSVNEPVIIDNITIKAISNL